MNRKTARQVLLEKRADYFTAQMEIRVLIDNEIKEFRQIAKELEEMEALPEWQAVVKAIKYLDNADTPTENRKCYDPESDTIILLKSKEV